MLLYCFLFIVLAYYDRIYAQVVDTHGPPRLEQNPIFLDSYVPASMQMIAHVTDLMKYEPSPIDRPITPEVPSTLPHRPAIFAPSPPYTGQQITTTRRPWWKIGEPQYPDIGGYFNRYRNGWSLFSDDSYGKPQSRSLNVDTTNSDNDLDLLGVLAGDLYKKVNTVEESDDFGDFEDVENQVEKFSADYDDEKRLATDNSSPFLRKKRPPPTRAYVTLLSLYDNLNKEAKKLSLNKYNGYSRTTLLELERLSRGTSASQLRGILAKVTERRDITETQLVKKITALVEDLDQPNSYINQALKDIPPLEFDIKF